MHVLTSCAYARTVAELQLNEANGGAGNHAAVEIAGRLSATHIQQLLGLIA
jgi:hypothetical protein